MGEYRGLRFFLRLAAAVRQARPALTLVRGLPATDSRPGVRRPRPGRVCQTRERARRRGLHGRRLPAGASPGPGQPTRLAPGPHSGTGARGEGVRGQEHGRAGGLVPDRGRLRLLVGGVPPSSREPGRPRPG